MTDAGDMNLGLETLKGFSGKMVQAALGFIGTIVFARLLGPRAFGGFYFLLTLVMILDRPLRGYAEAVKKRYSETSARKGEILGAVLLVNAAAFVLVTGVILSLGNLLHDATNVTNAALVFVVLFVALDLFYPFQKLLEAQGWIGLETWNDTFRSVLTLGFQLVFVLAGFGAAGMGYGLAAASIAVIPVSLHYLDVRPQMPSYETLLSLWEYGRYSTINAVVGKAYDRIDVLLIGTFLTTAAVGHYEVGYKLTVPATFLVGVTGAGLMSKVSHNLSRGRDVGDDITNAISYVSIFSVPIFFGAVALPEQLVVTAYGPEYAEGAALLAGLGLYRLFQSQSGIYRQAIGGLDLPEVRLKIDAISLAVNVVFGLVLLTIYGALGVVLGTVLAGIVRYLLSAYTVSRRVPDVDVLPRPLVDQLFAGAVMYGVVEVVHGELPVSNWMDLGVIVGSGAVIYGLVLLGVSKHFRFTLRSLWLDVTS